MNENFNNFWHALGVNNYSFAQLTLILLLNYLVKSRSHSVTVDTNEFILGSACVGSEIINRITTNRTVSRKVIRVTSHHFYHISTPITQVGTRFTYPQETAHPSSNHLIVTKPGVEPRTS